jgi:hypothetical protein
MTNDNDTLTASRQEKWEESEMAAPIDVPLTAKISGKVITVTGPGDADIPEGQNATRFNFILTDGTGFNVKFDTLDAADATNRPPPSGQNSTQIEGVQTFNNKSPREAGFTDKNNNNPKNGKLKIAYQWNFTCDAGATVEPYDPIITNGGRTGPIL